MSERAGSNRHIYKPHEMMGPLAREEAHDRVERATNKRDGITKKRCHKNNTLSWLKTGSNDELGI